MEKAKLTGAAAEVPGPQQLNPFYSSLRKDLCAGFEEIRDQLNADSVRMGRDYLTDLDFGLYLYKLLNTYEFSVRTASYDPVWFYLSVAVVPDLVYRRYGRISADRYYAARRRIWLKCLWWYIHLSLQVSGGQADYEKTRSILLHNSTDTILQIVDRAGPGGYRVDVTRELMRRYAEKAEKDSGGELLRRLMVLHVARVRLVEPALYEGGVEAYVDSLFNFYGE